MISLRKHSRPKSRSSSSLHVVRLAVVEVEVERSLGRSSRCISRRRGSRKPGSRRTGRRRRPRQTSRCGTGARRTLPVAVGVGLRRSVRRSRAAGVERRIGVDQGEAADRQLRHQGEVVAPRITRHSSPTWQAARHAVSPPAGATQLAAICSRVGRRTLRTSPSFSQQRDQHAGDVDLPPAEAVECGGREDVVVVVPRLAQRRDAPAPSCSSTCRTRRTGGGRRSGRSS